MNKEEILKEIKNLTGTLDTASYHLAGISDAIKDLGDNTDTQLADEILSLIQAKKGAHILNNGETSSFTDKDAVDDAAKKKPGRPAGSKTKSKRQLTPKVKEEPVTHTVEDYAKSTLDDMIATARSINTKYGTEGAEALTASVSHLGAERIVEITIDQVPEVMVAFDTVLKALEVKYPVGK